MPKQRVFIATSTVSHVHLQGEINLLIESMNRSNWRAVSIEIVLGGDGFSAWILGEQP